MDVTERPAGTVFEMGEVVAAPRPRFRRDGRTYMPGSYERWKDAVRRAYLDAGGTEIEGPVALTVDVMRHLPGSLPKRVSEQPDTVRPDVDNVAKGVMDALEGAAYADDAQVVSLCVLKCPRTRGVPDRMRVSVRPY